MGKNNRKNNRKMRAKSLSILRSKSKQDQITVARKGPPLPTELILEIIKYLIPPWQTVSHHNHQRDLKSFLNNVLLTNSQFRDVALEHYTKCRHSIGIEIMRDFETAFVHPHPFFANHITRLQILVLVEPDSPTGTHITYCTARREDSQGQGTKDLKRVGFEFGPRVCPPTLDRKFSLPAAKSIDVRFRLPRLRSDPGYPDWYLPVQYQSFQGCDVWWGYRMEMNDTFSPRQFREITALEYRNCVAKETVRSAIKG